MRATWALAAAFAITTTTERSPTVARAMATSATNSKLPTLKGVVFDMDDTLVRSNLNIRSMYKQVFGVDPPESFDILKDMAAIEDDTERDRAYAIVADIEAENRKKMKLMPGCVELLAWLTAHKIPTALVTRNNRATTDVFCKKLSAVTSSTTSPELINFGRIITRDDTVGADDPIPPKPDPTAMKLIARDCFGVDLDDGGGCPGILMVGDSVSNDVAFGKNAGVSTALLKDEIENFAGDAGSTDLAADLVVTDLTELPKNLWKTFELEGPLGNTPVANTLPLHGSAPPNPESNISKLVVEQSNDEKSLEEFSDILEDLSLEELLEKDPTNGNTGLIWAAEKGNAAVADLLLDAVCFKLIEDNGDESTADASETLEAFANHRGYLGATALCRAARRGYTTVLQTLLKHTMTFPCDPDVPNDKLQHPLHFAAFKKNPEALEYLLAEMDANPWVLDRKGRIPLEDTSCPTCQSLLRTAMEKSNQRRN